MSIKTILVHLGTEQHAADLTGVAASIGEASTAHLVFLHVVPDAVTPSVVPPEVVGELIDAQRVANEAAAAKIEAVYRRAVAGLRLTNEWRRVEAHFETVAEVVVRNGRAADLVIVGQADERVALLGGIGTAEEVMLLAGRPVLVVPVRGQDGQIGNRILVAWKDSRESARAVFDALPFLVAAEAVFILTVRPERRKGHQVREIPGTDIATALAQHGVKCEIVEVSGADATVGDEISNQIRQRRCDMVVMGGYGHSRLREVVLGGATRSMFDTATVPVLMSH